jgi:hypothetical protein
VRTEPAESASVDSLPRLWQALRARSAQHPNGHAAPLSPRTKFTPLASGGRTSSPEFGVPAAQPCARNARQSRSPPGALSADFDCATGLRRCSLPQDASGAGDAHRSRSRTSGADVNGRGLDCARGAASERSSQLSPRRAGRRCLWSRGRFCGSGGIPLRDAQRADPAVAAERSSFPSFAAHAGLRCACQAKPVLIALVTRTGPARDAPRTAEPCVEEERQRHCVARLGALTAFMRGLHQCPAPEKRTERGIPSSLQRTGRSAPATGGRQSVRAATRRRVGSHRAQLSRSRTNAEATAWLRRRRLRDQVGRANAINSPATCDGVALAIRPRRKVLRVGGHRAQGLRACQAQSTSSPLGVRVGGQRARRRKTSSYSAQPPPLQAARPGARCPPTRRTDTQSLAFASPTPDVTNHPIATLPRSEGTARMLGALGRQMCPPVGPRAVAVAPPCEALSCRMNSAVGIYSRCSV